MARRDDHLRTTAAIRGATVAPPIFKPLYRLNALASPDCGSKPAATMGSAMPLSRRAADGGRVAVVVTGGEGDNGSQVRHDVHAVLVTPRYALCRLRGREARGAMLGNGSASGAGYVRCTHGRERSIEHVGTLRVGGVYWERARKEESGSHAELLWTRLCARGKSFNGSCVPTCVGMYSRGVRTLTHLPRVTQVMQQDLKEISALPLCASKSQRRVAVLAQHLR